jgi:DNA helicase-2/ATP-dependent DNA helicase PcrA
LTLRTAIAALNTEQREAVLYNDNTVVLAGPGSGKTDTVVLKVAYLLASEIQPPRGVACITFSNEAAREFTMRLRRHGLRPGPQLFLGTVHGFCLTRIIRPYARVTGAADLAERVVLSMPRRRALIERALEVEGVTENPTYFDPTLSTIRKALACDETLEPYDPRHVGVSRRYEQLLVDQRAIDFDAMTFEALRLLRTENVVVDLLVARYPWLAVDEYQDLGGPLHNIVLALREGGAKIFAVGDPDQCVYGFSGAHPRYFSDLASDTDFHCIRLRFNYRAGRRLIDAAEAALGASRGYEPDPERGDEGEVRFAHCEPGLETQAKLVAEELLPELMADGVPAHEIAILYRGRGPMLDELVKHLAIRGVPHIVERDASFPDSPLVKWLQRCAIWALDSSALDIDGFSDLAIPYLNLVADAGQSNGRGEIHDRVRLMRVLDSPVVPGDELGSWIRRFDDLAHLDELLACDGSRPDDRDALTVLEHAVGDGDGPTVADFARGAKIHGRVVVTTYHSSKGRQFEVVVLPGLQETIMPSARWNPRLRRKDTPNLIEDRRLFYVGLTRARRQAILCYSPSFQNRNGYLVDGHSRFVDEVAARLGVDP